jgi:hypothetical protein
VSLTTNDVEEMNSIVAQTVKHQEVSVTTNDIEEMNSIVEQTVKHQEELKKNSRKENFIANLVQHDEAKPDTPVKDPTRDNPNSVIVANTRPKDCDVSVLTEPTSFRELGTPSPNKRISGTTATFHEEMRSQRSESEQKRIDNMHAIFLKAGLMSRVKRSTEGAFAQNEQPQDKAASTRDLLMSWQGKDQTQPETIGKLF